MNANHRRTIVMACKIVGGETVLAERFGCQVELVLSWANGFSPIPGEVFMKAADIIHADNDRRITGTLRP